MGMALNGLKVEITVVVDLKVMGQHVLTCIEGRSQFLFHRNSIIKNARFAMCATILTIWFSFEQNHNKGSKKRSACYDNGNDVSLVWYGA